MRLPYRTDIKRVVSKTRFCAFALHRAFCQVGRSTRDRISNFESWRPRGRQFGRQLSPREIWTYDDKNELAASWPASRPPADIKLFALRCRVLYTPPQPKARPITLSSACGNSRRLYLGFFGGGDQSSFRIVLRPRFFVNSELQCIAVQGCMQRAQHFLSGQMEFHNYFILGYLQQSDRARECPIRCTETLSVQRILLTLYNI